MMRLSALLSALPSDLSPTSWVRSDASLDPVIRGISYDSRHVAPGDLFVALRGAASDGHAYLQQALDLGAAALLVEEVPAASLPADVPGVVVPDTRRALAPIATRFFGEPANELTLVGLTGTNGKTSTSYLIESILSAAGVRTGLIGTIEARFAGERIRATNTTPESLDLQRLLRSMQTRNIEAAVMEVSSHGLELGRVHGCRFAVAGFTNLTQDHLDFHGSMEAYRRSKERLFRDHLLSGASAVINIDDPAGEKMVAAAQASGARVLRCTREAGREAEVALTAYSARLDGSEATISLPGGALELFSPLVGDFNLDNLLVGCGVAAALGVAHDAIREGVERCPQVPGRMEVVSQTADQPTVIVDYAHTPDAVEKLLHAVRPLAQGRLVTVFGCGGDRDRAKRPLMAGAVVADSDRVIATSDNPRTEDPMQILADVEAGLTALRRVEPGALATSESSYAVIPDRRSAIETAIAIARAGDTVVLAGKGHEDYQIVGHEKRPFDDRDEARRALAARLAGTLAPGAKATSGDEA